MRAQRAKTGCARFRRGRWEIDFRDALGRRHQEALGDLREKTMRMRKEAEGRLHKRLEEVGAGTYQAPSEFMTVAEIVEKYVANHVSAKASADTVAQYQDLARLHVIPHIGEFIARDMKRAHVEAFRTTLMKTPARQPRRSTKKKHKTAPPPSRMISARTIEKVMQLLSAAFKYSCSHEWTVRNPCTGVARPKKIVTSAEGAIVAGSTLTPDEATKLLTHASERYRLLIKVAIVTGLRQSELLGLQWGDVDWNDRTFFVRRRWRNGRFSEPKTANSVRRVEFPQAIVGELKAWRLQCPKPKEGEKNFDLVFPNAEGKPESGSNISHYALAPALRRAGLRKVRFHDLRHTYASLMLSAGENVAVVSRQLGHASIAITLQVYRHCLPGEGKGLSDRLAARVFGGAVVVGDPAREPGAA